jgi:hypothetical protein
MSENNRYCASTKLSNDGDIAGRGWVLAPFDASTGRGQIRRRGAALLDLVHCVRCCLSTARVRRRTVAPNRRTDDG